MNIFYDYQSIFRQKFGGVTRYHYELYKELEKREGISVNCKVYGSPNYYFKEILGYQPVTNLNCFSGIVNKINQFSNHMEISSKKYDVIHPTWYDEYCYINKNKGKYVVTIHDMIHELFTDCFDMRPEKEILGKKFWIYNADEIIAVSENTKKDILKLYDDIDERKITVIYHGNNKMPEPQVVQTVYGDYLLYVGNRKIKYKNFVTLLEGFKIALKHGGIDKLICAGGGAFTEEEKRMMQELGLVNRVVQMQVTDAELAYLYNNAICLIIPSLYEGFGFPILEAFENNCPVIVSNTSCLPEVGGEAVMYFNPWEREELAMKIDKLITDSQLRRELIVRGRRQKDKFSWASTSKETLDVYRKLTL